MLLRKFSFLKDQSNSGFAKVLTEVFGPIDRDDPAKLREPLDDATIQVNRKQKQHAFSEVPDHAIGEAEFEERRPSKT